MQKIIFLFFSLASFHMIQAQQEIPLYEDSIPNSRPSKDAEKKETGKDQITRLSKVSQPTLSIFLPEKSKTNGAAVIIIPGGSYSIVAIGHEGFDVVPRLNELGITAFVLKYRLPSDETMVNKEIGPLQDAQRAIQLVRERAASWGIDGGRIGIMGFSAGGHLASTAGTHFNHVVIDNKQGTSLRPDFMILLYPVISFADSIGHKGSRNNLLGQDPPAEKIWEYSNELQVTAQTPPAFLVHAEDDKVVPVQNSLNFYEALLHHGIGAELHIYPKGGHGFGLHNRTTKDDWMDRLKNWMEANGWLKK